MSKKIIFHYAGPFYEEENNAEKIRPKRMYEAFKNLGYDITLMIGSYSERNKIFQNIKNNIEEYSFIYSENRTLPLRLSGKKHLPILLKNCDFKLFKLAKKKDIPIGVFYRDIYWDYPSFKEEVGYFKHLLSIPFYHEELKFYSKYANITFVPSKSFIHRVEKKYSANYIPLFPGCEVIKLDEVLNVEKKINAIYVGSIRPPFYDISDLIDKMSNIQTSNLSLTIITRERDYNNTKHYYKFSTNVEVLHLTGNKLKEKLQESNISIINLSTVAYMELCMPMKLFEAIGAGLPIVSYGDNPVSDYVKENNIGWVVDEKSKENIFAKLLQNPQEIMDKTKKVCEIRKKHTWEKRAEQVIKNLINK